MAEALDERFQLYMTYKAILGNNKKNKQKQQKTQLPKAPQKPMFFKLTKRK